MNLKHKFNRNSDRRRENKLRQRGMNEGLQIKSQILSWLTRRELFYTIVAIIRHIIAKKNKLENLEEYQAKRVSRKKYDFIRSLTIVNDASNELQIYLEPNGLPRSDEKVSTQRTFLVPQTEYTTITKCFKLNKLETCIKVTRNRNYKKEFQEEMLSATKITNTIGDARINKLDIGPIYKSQKQFLYKIASFSKFAKHQDLYRYLFSKGNSLTSLGRLHLVFQVMDAIFALHENGIIHQDIKAENILVDEDETNLPLLKLCDFEYCVEKKPNATRCTNPSCVEESCIDIKYHNVACGTKGYESPEILLGFCNPYSDEREARKQHKYYFKDCGHFSKRKVKYFSLADKFYADFYHGGKITDLKRRIYRNRDLTAPHEKNESWSTAITLCEILDLNPFQLYYDWYSLIDRTHPIINKWEPWMQQVFFELIVPALHPIAHNRSSILEMHTWLEQNKNELISQAIRCDASKEFSQQIRKLAV